MKEIELVSSQDASTSITSVAVNLGDLTVYSMHCNFSGSTLGGTVKLQASNDNSDWVDISGASQTVASADSHVFNVVNASYRYVRLSWSPTGGTGNLTVIVVIKEDTARV